MFKLGYLVTQTDLTFETSACLLFSLTKLMVSRDFARSTITNQISINHRDLHLTPEFERAIDLRCQGLKP